MARDPEFNWNDPADAAEANAIRERFAKHGFELWSTGGGCEAFVRTDAEGITEYVTNTNLGVPVSLLEACDVGAYETPDHVYTGEDFDFCTMTRDGQILTCRDVLAALEHPSTEYYLLTLRIENLLPSDNA